MKTTRSILSLLLTTAFLVAQMGPGRDTVVLVTGQRFHSVKVKSDTIEGVVFEAQMGPQVVEQRYTYEQVASVDYGTKPISYIQASLDFKQGHYDKALTNFLKALNDKLTATLLKQYIMFKIGECRYYLRKYSDAEKAYQGLLKAMPKTRFYPDVLYRLAEIKLASSDKNLWQKAYNDLSSLPSRAKTSKWGEKWVGKFALLAGHSARKVNKDPLPFYLEASKSKDLEVRLQAGAEIAEVYASQKQFEKAIQNLTEALKGLRTYKPRDTTETVTVARLRAYLYNRIGDVYKSWAQSAPQAHRVKLYRDALLEGYLRVALLLQNVPEEHQRALYESAQCFKIIGKKDTALEFFQDLADLYPESEYGKKARTMLGTSKAEPKKEGQ